VDGDLLGFLLSALLSALLGVLLGALLGALLGDCLGLFHLFLNAWRSIRDPSENWAGLTNEGEI
jgi:ABC-type nitrate/sulfonate/bicarbonate transport system permease component